MQVAYIVILESAVSGPCQEFALVLQSQNIASEILVAEGRYQLLVPEDDLYVAQQELVAYQRENVNWKPRYEAPKIVTQNPWPGIFSYVVLMVLFGWAAGEGLFSANWFSVGKVDAAKVLDGEWWRTFTALTLHADAGHLFGNLGFGILFGYFAGQFFGSGLGWLGILLSGAVGNLINSYLQSSYHTSVGASTAIFGALGLVAAYSWRRKFFAQDRWVSRLGPIVGGIALLAFTGTGGERTDVGAHLTGFVSGICIGSVFALVPAAFARSSSTQWIAGALAIGLLAFSWSVALR